MWNTHGAVPQPRPRIRISINANRWESHSHTPKPLRESPGPPSNRKQLAWVGSERSARGLHASISSAQLIYSCWPRPSQPLGDINRTHTHHMACHEIQRLNGVTLIPNQKSLRKRAFVSRALLPLFYRVVCSEAPRSALHIWPTFLMSGLFRASPKFFQRKLSSQEPSNACNSLRRKVAPEKLTRTCAFLRSTCFSLTTCLFMVS